MKKHDFPQAPVVLGLILGDRLEISFRQALSVSQNDYSIFFNRPISAVLLAVAVVSFLLPAWKSYAARRRSRA
jgi:putative tricarboxylic transport membrane protein